MRSQKHLLASTVISAAANYVMDTRWMKTVGVEVIATVNSTAKTAAAAIQATQAIGTITYTATSLFAGALGNTITIAITSGGTAGSEVVTVVGTAISVQADVTPVTGSSGTQVKAAIAASVPAALLVTGSGTDATVAVTQIATALAGGVNSKFSITNNTISIAAHGYFTGQVIQATKSGAAFPGGISASTDYFVYKIDANTISLFDTLAHALAAVQVAGVTSSTGIIDITSDASASSTITLTPTAISGVSYKLQKSIAWDPESNPSPTWVDAVAGDTNSVVTNTITVSASSMASITNCYTSAINTLFAISAGTVQIKVYGITKEY